MITTANLLISNPVAKLVKWSLDWGFSKTSKRKECIAKYRRIYGWLHNLIYFGNGQAFHLLGEWRNCFFSYFCAKSIEIKTFSFAIYKRFPLPTHLVQLFHPGQTIKLRIDTIAFISVVRTNPTLAQWFSPRVPVELTPCYFSPIVSQSVNVKVGLRKMGKSFCAREHVGKLLSSSAPSFQWDPKDGNSPVWAKGKLWLSPHFWLHGHSQEERWQSCNMLPHDCDMLPQRRFSPFLHLVELSASGEEKCFIDFLFLEGEKGTRQHYGFDGAGLLADTLSQGPVWMQLSFPISPRSPGAEQSNFGGVTKDWIAHDKMNALPLPGCPQCKRGWVAAELWSWQARDPPWAWQKQGSSFPEMEQKVPSFPEMMSLCTTGTGG